MKMEAVGKSEELLDSEVPPQITQQKVDTQAEEGSLEIEASSPKDGAQDVPDSSGLSSMPCLLMELRRDSSESQLASTESDKPTAGRVYESDSSNHCMLSPSSSGHLADSDTMSSADENETLNPEAITEGGDPAIQGAAVGRKSRRSRSESETSTMAAKKNRQSSDKQNGRVAKIKGHRSQKHKERIRLLRQKREAAARKKYNLLQDSSTSDSDLTCYSSSSSSDEDEEVSGSSKTITAEIPGDVLKGKWTNLRDSLGRELKKRKHPGSDDAGTSAYDNTASWPLLNMDFLKEQTTPAQTVPNLELDESTEDTSRDVTLDADTFCDTTTSPEPQPPKMKASGEFKRNWISLQEKHLERLTNVFKDNVREDNADEDLEFFKSLLPYMKRLELVKKMKLRHEIQAAVLKAVQEK
ncbi:hypothetical protein FKM82_029359 [Ascaphus truei]